MGFLTAGLHLAPFDLSGYNVCQFASQGCAAACLNTAGRGAYSRVQNARIAKTRKFFENKNAFAQELEKEILAAIRKAEKANLTPCFRLNLTSDLPWENIGHDGISIVNRFPNVQFYDYTKNPDRMSDFLDGKFPSNYHLTFSRSEENGDLCIPFLKSQGNVAVVFRGKLPETWQGFPVVNGDESDLRFLDDKGVVVGLVQKGKARKDHSGFVVEGVQ